MPVDITVAICTYHRPGLLADCVESLCQQTLEPERFEIIVVDNASQEQARQVIHSLHGKHPVHQITYMQETGTGTSYARNSALRIAKGCYVAFLDDDAVAHPSWLECALQVIRDYQEPACIGGQIIPRYLHPRPEWFRDAYETRSWGEQPRLLNPDESFSGSNMIWRRERLLEIGAFNEELGPRGENFSVGEDTAVFLKLWRENPSARLVYSPDLKVSHSVPAHKLRVSYILKRAFIEGGAVVRLKDRPFLAWRVYTCLRCLGSILVRLILALWHIRRYPAWQNWAVEEGRTIFFRAGTACAALGIYYRPRSASSIS
jgi:glycosyltransferase involved in cell wall biosynthesis